MLVTSSINDVREATKSCKKNAQTIGFVPTMGALHQGHFSLVEQARKFTDFVIVSIFVNPTQFSPNEDLDKYPRTFESDCDGCLNAGTDLIFAPTPEIMYPDENLTWVSVDKLTNYLCGASRPNHFRGVTTVVTKLFNIVQPDMAFFGQKDAQQLAVLKKMAQQLNMPVTIVGCPIVREHDGLAMSSRNKYLNPEERQQALCLSEAIKTAEQMFSDGTRNASEIIKYMSQTIADFPAAKIDYISIVDNELLQPVEIIEKPALTALAVYIGQTRLIDNVVLIP